MHWLLPDARAHGKQVLNLAQQCRRTCVVEDTHLNIPKAPPPGIEPVFRVTGGNTNHYTTADSACLSNQPLDNFWWVQPNEHAITLSGSFEWAQINRGWSHESSNKLHKLLFIKPSKSLHRTQRSTGLQVLILGFNLTEACIDTNACSAPTCRNTHRGARTHDHKVKGLALCRLS